MREGRHEGVVALFAASHEGLVLCLQQLPGRAGMHQGRQLINAGQPLDGLHFAQMT